MKDKEKEYNDKRESAEQDELDLIEKQRDDYYDRGMKYSNASTALFAIGGAAAVAAAALFSLSFRNNKQERKTGLKIHVDLNSAGLIIHF